MGIVTSPDCIICCHIDISIEIDGIVNVPHKIMRCKIIARNPTISIESLSVCNNNAEEDKKTHTENMKSQKKQNPRISIIALSNGATKSYQKNLTGNRSQQNLVQCVI